MFVNFNDVTMIHTHLVTWMIFARLLSHFRHLMVVVIGIEIDHIYIQAIINVCNITLSDLVARFVFPAGVSVVTVRSKINHFLTVSFDKFCLRSCFTVWRRADIRPDTSDETSSPRAPPISIHWTSRLPGADANAVSSHLSSILCDHLPLLSCIHENDDWFLSVP
jgi:hypothetical protein